MSMVLLQTGIMPGALKKTLTSKLKLRLKLPYWKLSSALIRRQQMSLDVRQISVSWQMAKIEVPLYAFDCSAHFVLGTCSRASQFDATPNVDIRLKLMPLAINTPSLISIAGALPWYKPTRAAHCAPPVCTTSVFDTCANARLWYTKMLA